MTKPANAPAGVADALQIPGAIAHDEPGHVHHGHITATIMEGKPAVYINTKAMPPRTGRLPSATVATGPECQFAAARRFCVQCEGLCRASEVASMRVRDPGCVKTRGAAKILLVILRGN